MTEKYEITDYNYIMSAIGNAYFSNMSFDQLWSCVMNSSDPAEFDAAVEAQIKLNQLVDGVRIP